MNVKRFSIAIAIGGDRVEFDLRADPGRCRPPHR